MKEGNNLLNFNQLKSLSTTSLISQGQQLILRDQDTSHHQIIKPAQQRDHDLLFASPNRECLFIRFLYDNIPLGQTAVIKGSKRLAIGQRELFSLVHDYLRNSSQIDTIEINHSHTRSDKYAKGTLTLHKLSESDQKLAFKLRDHFNKNILMRAYTPNFYYYELSACS